MRRETERKNVSESKNDSIDPLNEGLVTLPLGVEKLSPRLKIKLFA